MVLCNIFTLIFILVCIENNETNFVLTRSDSGLPIIWSCFLTMHQVTPTLLSRTIWSGTTSRYFSSPLQSGSGYGEHFSVLPSETDLKGHLCVILLETKTAFVALLRPFGKGHPERMSSLDNSLAEMRRGQVSYFEEF